MDNDLKALKFMAEYKVAPILQAKLADMGIVRLFEFAMYFNVESDITSWVAAELRQHLAAHPGDKFTVDYELAAIRVRRAWISGVDRANSLEDLKNDRFRTKLCVQTDPPTTSKFS